MGFLQPRAQLVVHVRDRPYWDEMSTPAGPERLLSDDAGVLQGSTERKTRNKVILSRREPGKAYACDTHKTGLLRKDLNVSERPKHPDESLRELQD